MCGGFFSPHNMDKFVYVRVGFSNHFFEARMPTFHMVVGALSRNIKVIPLVELKLAVDPGAVKVVNKLIYLW